MDLKTRLSSLVLATGVALLALPGIASAQLEANLGALTDDNVRGYMQPLAGAMSGTLNSSIFQTGHVGSDGLHFHVQANVMGVSFSDDDRTYRPTDPTGFESDDPDFVASTIIGSATSAAQNGQAGTVLHHPGGFDMENFTLASPQLEVSGFYGTRAVLRWISLDLGDADLGDLNLVGFGVQHSISQYMTDAPIDVAVGGFYQSFSIGDDLVDSKMYHFNVTGSMRRGILEPYVGIGFDSFDMDANYKSSTGSDDEFEVEVDFERESNLHLTLGGRLNFGFVILNGELNMAAENGVAVGLAFGY